ncbi:hypothetical protein BJ138DRAFT_1177724 [Hygrophoropsis aurantiaca]|uniref:Uncharacterized protein n=1 Tax=Hygrophoropsis aurantiaca TaxID=72124 RepID=A0ACB8ALN3_9AGAM|nr:hypothetical protein BJ138DRAFT_1177724 [Hygrophoropsis aurantiaca]
MMSTLAVMPYDVSRTCLSSRTNQPYSYSRPHIHGTSFELDCPAQSTSRFPISSERPESQPQRSATPPACSPGPIHPRYDPLHILSQAPPCVPKPHAQWAKDPAPEVAPGVLSDGVLTAAFPPVRDFLDAAASEPPASPPLPVDKRILALAALSVFYHPLHPAHWVFWNKEQKRATAAIVQTVLDTTPTPIMSPIGWIAVPENLWILSSTQIAYSGALASVPWYTTYVPPETAGRMSLRKRKAPAILSDDKAGSGDETADDDAPISPPPRKRAKTRKSTANANANANAIAKASAPTPAGSGDGGTITGDSPTEADVDADAQAAEAVLLLSADPPPSLTKAAKRERIQSPALDLESRIAVDEVVAAETPPPRASLRQKERKARTIASPASTVSELTPARSSPLYRETTPLIARGSSSSSSVISEPNEGAESASGSSTAVSVQEDDGSKAHKVVHEGVPEEGEGGEENETPAKSRKKSSARRRPRAPRTKAVSRARGKSKVVEEDANAGDDAGDDELLAASLPVSAPPRRSRTKARRR